MIPNENRITKIGNFEPENPFFLAPMAGLTDAPMRRICGEMGASLVYTEMVSAKGLYYGDRKSDLLLFRYPEEKPTAFQIFGHEPDIIAYAAEKLDERDHVILDINMGCPVPKIVKNQEGSALMKQPRLVEEIIRAAVKHTSKPVTAKIRAGFNDESRNAVEVAKAIENGGGAAVAVHGRTREQYYAGRADWDIIRQVKEAVRIPVIGNGDITDPSSAGAMMEQTGCDFVMVARAARGNPWLFRDLDDWWNGRAPHPAPSMAEKKAMMKRQLRDMIELKGEYAAVREMRSISGWYLRGVPGSAKMRGMLNRIDDADTWYRAISEIPEERSSCGAGEDKE